MDLFVSFPSVFVFDRLTSCLEAKVIKGHEKKKHSKVNNFINIAYVQPILRLLYKTKLTQTRV